MARRVGILRTECRPEGIYLRKCSSSQLALQLPRHGQVRGAAEEILRIVYPPLFGTGRILQVERRHLEHGAGTLRIGSRYDRRMQIEKSLVVKKFVNGKGHRVADAQHRTEGIGTRTQMRYLTQEFERMALLLKRIRFGVGLAVHLQLPRLYFDTLAGTGRFDKQTARADAGAGGYPLQQFAVESGDIGHYLDIVNCRTVVEGDERHVLVSPLGTYPSLYDHFGIHPAGAQQLRDHRPFHFRHCVNTLFVTILFSNQTQISAFFPILTQERRHKWAGKPQKTSLYRTDDTIALSVPYKSNIFVSVRTRVPCSASRINRPCLWKITGN